MTNTIKAKPYNKVKAIIIKKGFKQKDIAEKIGMNRSLLNIKINVRDFKTGEAKKLAELLDIKIDDIF
ncbi:helix-turn-helix transcriptional regulator [Staphylococcus schweitzeri]|uniref:Phage DNA-binding protein n=1 Tax=Staphylococcus schweitzeri TaxID=1654388 RepID=A0A077UDA6_9STAP|nr:helix-turn-helix transcriptional regulator [Staphylococcus schweitzeri]CDR26479.1 phage DNA-binding protein [Staphylococcus schweitzeri]